MEVKQDRQPESMRKVDVSHDFRRLFHENGDEILVHWDLHLQVEKTFGLVVVRQEMEETSLDGGRSKHFLSLQLCKPVKTPRLM